MTSHPCASGDWLSSADALMPKVRARKTNKANWTMDHLEKAVKLIDEQNFSIRKDAKTMNIPFASLHKRYKKNIVGTSSWP
ncbi:hypothetical protein HF086_003275 [Spodoptera exigua]|uniref:HTH psq-type domain-containing protein n=1 Tax=Spodoptera exigua TaxID=7107 RepID=A0A922MGQ8_SPOEX|nr:hypothetical protein HF086_003275 [Spodoptera exigua]